MILAASMLSIRAIPASKQAQAASISSEVILPTIKYLYSYNQRFFERVARDFLFTNCPAFRIRSNTSGLNCKGGGPSFRKSHLGNFTTDSDIARPYFFQKIGLYPGGTFTVHYTCRFLLQIFSIACHTSNTLTIQPGFSLPITSVVQHANHRHHQPTSLLCLLLHEFPPNIATSPL